MVSSPSSTSSLVTHSEEQLECTMERRNATASNQPQRRCRPVTEPNSWPTRRQVLAELVEQLRRERTAAHARGVGLDDAEHLVRIAADPSPVPGAAPPAVVVEEVT